MTMIWCMRNGEEVSLVVVDGIIGVTCPRVGKGLEAERREEEAIGGKREEGG